MIDILDFFSQAATELLNEAQRLIAHSIDSNSTQPIFMECIPYVMASFFG